MKKLIMICLLIGACAHAPVPTTQIIEVPVPVTPKHIDLKPCPTIPIIGLTPDSDWDSRLKAWNSSVVLQAGCIKSLENVIKEINK